MTELGDFLRACRDGLPPAEAGIPVYGRRRVPGLRREEVADLAGVSVDYVVRLEQGRVAGASRAVLVALAHALRLRPDEEAYLLRSVTTAGTGRAAGEAPVRPVSPATRLLLDSVAGVPALVLGRRMDVLAWNTLGAALFTDFGRVPPERRNHVRLAFLDPEVRSRYADWDRVARECVAYLRMEAGRYPDDPRLDGLVRELSAADPDFGKWWGSHQVAAQNRGRKRFVHPYAGELTLDFQVFDVRGDPAPEQMLVVYTAEPGSRSAEALTFLASWAGIPASR
ncbi:helix-turn-helix domain-containing protein [Streptomyces sp. NPDC058374]|uniref:helix-turn-helix domain-containing protein n=1 Tax=Streptomyces sp. NPDC058374 TaxID=3346466 RepID=UPI003651F236